MLDEKEKGIPDIISEGKVANKNDIGKMELVVILDMP